MRDRQEPLEKEHAAPEHCLDSALKSLKRDLSVFKLGGVFHVRIYF